METNKNRKQRGKIDRQKRKAIFLLFIPKAFKNEARLSINEKVSDVMFGVGWKGKDIDNNKNFTSEKAKLVVDRKCSMQNAKRYLAV
jgi:hypothetical protein